jgi:hypothetical protein
MARPAVALVKPAVRVRFAKVAVAAFRPPQVAVHPVALPLLAPARTSAALVLLGPAQVWMEELPAADPARSAASAQAVAAAVVEFVLPGT